jgi:hypothetical protein
MSGITNVGSQDQTNDNNTYQVRGFRQNKNYLDGQREPFAGMLYDSRRSTASRWSRVRRRCSPASPSRAVRSTRFPSCRARSRTPRFGSGVTRGACVAEIDANIPPTNRLATRFVFVRQAGDAWQQFAWSNRSVYYGALSYKIADNTRYTGTLQYFDYLASPPSPRSTVASSSALIGLTWHGKRQHQRPESQRHLHPVGFQPARAEQPPQRDHHPFCKPGAAPFQRPAVVARRRQFQPGAPARISA